MNLYIENPNNYMKKKLLKVINSEKLKQNQHKKSQLHSCCCCCSVSKSRLSLCSPMNCNMTGFPTLHYLLEFSQTHVCWFGDTIQPSHPLSPSSHPALNLSSTKVVSKESTSVLWPPHVKCWLIGKDSDAGKDWGQEEKGVTDDEMVGWYHQINEHEFEQTLGDSEGQGSLACCSPWGHKESDTMERLNNSSA